MCQDTGTAIISGKRGTHVLTNGRDEEYLARCLRCLRKASTCGTPQMSPCRCGRNETPAPTCLPRSRSISDTKPGHELGTSSSSWRRWYGSANKSYLFQKTKAVLNPTRFRSFLDEKLRAIGTAACPPYHLAVVVGGTSAEYALKVAKYASTRYYDSLPVHGGPDGHGYRDLEMEAEILKQTQEFGIRGPSSVASTFRHDVRVIRLPRHGASCPVAIAVSCSADRQALAKITPEGVFLEQFDEEPALPSRDHR